MYIKNDPESPALEVPDLILISPDTPATPALDNVFEPDNDFCLVSVDLLDGREFTFDVWAIEFVATLDNSCFDIL